MNDGEGEGDALSNTNDADQHHLVGRREDLAHVAQLLAVDFQSR